MKRITSKRTCGRGRTEITLILKFLECELFETKRFRKSLDLQIIIRLCKNCEYSSNEQRIVAVFISFHFSSVHKLEITFQSIWEESGICNCNSFYLYAELDEQRAEPQIAHTHRWCWFSATFRCNDAKIFSKHSLGYWLFLLSTWC